MSLNFVDQFWVGKAKRGFSTLRLNCDNTDTTSNAMVPQSPTITAHPRTRCHFMCATQHLRSCCRVDEPGCHCENKYPDPKWRAMLDAAKLLRSKSASPVDPTRACLQRMKTTIISCMRSSQFFERESLPAADLWADSL